MAHNVEYRDYPENCDRNKVKKELDSYVAHVDWQEGCRGLYNSIRWLDTIPEQSNLDAAHEVIEKLDRGDYDNLAVRYYAYERLPAGKTAEYDAAVKAAEDAYALRARVIYPQTLQAQFVGCKQCGSKLARMYLRTNNCPVCHADMRPEHILKAIAAAKNKVTAAAQKRYEYVCKHAPKNVRWLVKFEYHT